MKDDISTLIALQDTDNALAKLEQEIVSVRQRLADREQALRDKEAEASRCRERAVELEASRHGIKVAADEAADRIKERQGRMMQVQTSREHQALLKEIEDAKRQIREAEEQVLTVMEEAEAEEKRAAELDNLCAGERTLLAEASAQAEAAIAGIETKRSEAQVRRTQLCSGLTASILSRYGKLLVKRKGLAVTRITAGVCQGCFMTVPPQQFNLVRKGGELCACPACQRILFYRPEENEPLVKPARSVVDDDIEEDDEEDDFEDELNE